MIWGEVLEFPVMSFYNVRKPPETGRGGEWTKSLEIPAHFERYTIKSIRGLELPAILSIY